jgi:ankyrin repeat protein
MSRRRSVADHPALHEQARRLLAAVRTGNRSRALRLARGRTQLEAAGIACAAVLGDGDAVAAALRKDPALATAPDEDGWTPLLYACASPLPAADPVRVQGMSRTVELLLDQGADPNTYTLFDASDPQSRLPALYRACVTNQPRTVRLLLERGADPNDGESIYHAAELDRRPCLELLLAHGADISGRHSTWGNTPLYFIAGYEQGQRGAATAARGMRWLLEHGADPNVTSNECDETPLHRVAEQNSLRTAALLLEHGADPNRPRADGRTPFVLAVRTGNQAVAELLLGHGADPSRVGPSDEFLGACLRADEAKARAILARHSRLLDDLTSEERAALGWAVQHEREASVRMLEALGFDLGWEGFAGGTPIHQASWFGRPRMVELLISLGASVNARDTQFGSSALGWAAHGSANCRSADDDYCQVVEALLAAGATRKWGEPPEALASRRVASLLRRAT